MEKIAGTWRFGYFLLVGISTKSCDLAKKFSVPCMWHLHTTSLWNTLLFEEDKVGQYINRFESLGIIIYYRASKDVSPLFFKKSDVNVRKKKNFQIWLAMWRTRESKRSYYMYTNHPEIFMYYNFLLNFETYNSLISFLEKGLRVQTFSYVPSPSPTLLHTFPTKLFRNLFTSFGPVPVGYIITNQRSCLTHSSYYFRVIHAFF